MKVCGSGPELLGYLGDADRCEQISSSIRVVSSTTIGTSGLHGSGGGNIWEISG